MQTGSRQKEVFGGGRQSAYPYRNSGMPDASKVSGSLLILKVKELQAGTNRQQAMQQQWHIWPLMPARRAAQAPPRVHMLAGKPQYPKLAHSTVAWAGRGLTCP